jgi:hypothetical protein
MNVFKKSKKKTRAKIQGFRSNAVFHLVLAGGFPEP